MITSGLAQYCPVSETDRTWSTVKKTDGEIVEILHAPDVAESVGPA